MAYDMEIQSVRPAEILIASDPEDHLSQVQRVLKAGRPLVDYGLRHRGLGHAPPAGYVHLVSPAGVLEHYVPDMTVRVAAGTTLGDLQLALAAKHQFLPVDGADAQQTVAELVAHNVYGPLRISHGSTRDLLLGLRLIDGRGQKLSVGGRTVKNVAGYDVTRLMVNNLNTLGILTELTFRTYAIPAAVHRTEIRDADPIVIERLLTSLLTSDAAPWYVDWFDGVFRVAFAGTADGCRSQYQAMRRFMEGHSLPALSAVIEGDYAADSAARDACIAWRIGAAAQVKIIVPTSKAGSLAAQLRTVLPAGSHLHWLAAHGVIFAGGDWSLDQAKAFDQRLQSLLADFSGMRQWITRPGHSVALAPFAPAQPDMAMLKAIKQMMDPSNLLNPGRFG